MGNGKSNTEREIERISCMASTMCCYVKCEWILAVAFHVMFHIKYARFDRWFECNSYWQVLIKMHGSVWAFLLVVHLIKFALHIIIGAGASLEFCWLFEIYPKYWKWRTFYFITTTSCLCDTQALEYWEHTAQCTYSFILTHFI